MIWIKLLGDTFGALQKKVIWPKKILNFMHGLKSAILAILPEFRRLAGLACPVRAALPSPKMRPVSQSLIYPTHNI